MFVRRVLLCAAFLLPLAGCAKTAKPFTAADASIAGPAKPDDSHLHQAGDDGPLANDPVANAPPMPVAVLEEINKLKAGKSSAVAFLGPTITSVTHERNIIGPAPAATQPYLLDSGDRVRIFVYGQPNLSHVYPIDAAGFIAVPLIGSVKARGVTTYHLGQMIASELKVSFVKDPQVTVEVAASRPFYILGEVRAAGQYAFEPGLTVQAAVAIAGGFSPRASERTVRITRRLNGMVSELHAPITEPVRPGDTITIEERWF